MTSEEEARIVELQRVHDNKWATIARFLHGQYHWNSALHKMQQDYPATAMEDVDDIDG